MNTNPYEILGVAKNADDGTIKKAYHKLVMKYHPDKNPGDKAAEDKFKEINNAFDILKDPQKRAAYDRFGDAAFAGGNGASASAGGYGGFNGNPFGNMGGGSFRFDMGGAAGMDDILREAMRSFGFDMGDMGGGFARRDMRGRDMLDEAVISLKEAFSGKTHTVKFTVGGKQRTLEVKIPAGVADGARLRMAGAGEAGQNGGAPGDFYIDVHVRMDKKFARAGDDLFMRGDVPFTTLALGGEIEIETIDDKKLQVRVPAGTQVGERLRVRGHGMPVRRRETGDRRQFFGDLYIEVGTTVPKKLSEKQKKALHEFADAKDKKTGWF